MIEQKRKACKCLEENERILTPYDLLNENKTNLDSCSIYLERNYLLFLNLVGEEILSEDEFNQLDKEIQEIINKPCNQSKTQNGEKTRSEWKVQLTDKSSRDCIDETEQLEVTLGKQIWMTRNLNVDKFINGDLISQAKTPAEWEKANDEKPACLMLL